MVDHRYVAPRRDVNSTRPLPPPGDEERPLLPTIWEALLARIPKKDAIVDLDEALDILGTVHSHPYVVLVHMMDAGYLAADFSDYGQIDPTIVLRRL